MLSLRLFKTQNKMNNGNLMLVICGIALILSGVILECFYNKKVKEIERNCHCNLVNDGETGCQIKQVKANGFKSANSETGSNSVYVGWKCECGSTKLNITVKDKPFCFLCGRKLAK